MLWTLFSLDVFAIRSEHFHTASWQTGCVSSGPAEGVSPGHMAESDAVPALKPRFGRQITVEDE